MAPLIGGDEQKKMWNMALLSEAARKQIGPRRILLHGGGDTPQGGRTNEALLVEFITSGESRYFWPRCFLGCGGSAGAGSVAGGAAGCGSAVQFAACGTAGATAGKRTAVFARSI